MIDHIGLVYVENNIELSGPIKLYAICDRNRQDNDVINLPHVAYIEKLNFIVVTDQTGCDLWWKPDMITTWSTIQVGLH